MPVPSMELRSFGLGLALLVGGCAPAATPPPAAVSLTADARLTADDDIGGLDAVLDASGAVHVAWSEHTHFFSGTDGRARIVYRRGSGTPLRWGPRIVLADGGGFGNPQVVADADGVHVFAGDWLHHWWLPGGGGAIRDLGDMLGENGPHAAAFDAIAAGGGIIVAFTQAYVQGDANVYGLRWAGGNYTRLAIATSPRGRAAQPARPILRFYGRRLMLLWADESFYDVFAAKPGVVPVFRQDMAVRVAWSDDDGLAWTKPVQISPLDSASIGRFAAAGTQQVPVAFLAGSGVYASRLRDGAWTAPARIADFEPGFFSGSKDTAAIAATQCDGHAAVAWVDARFRRSDRRWWNPLGGFPWGDDPDWDNNDVFVATDALVANAATLVPLRLTAPESLTRAVALVARDGRLLVFRTGRARVHKSPTDMGAPPEVTQASVPCG